LASTFESVEREEQWILYTQVYCFL
jgi:hypothetical protein